MDTNSKLASILSVKPQGVDYSKSSISNLVNDTMSNPHLYVRDVASSQYPFINNSNFGVAHNYNKDLAIKGNAGYSETFPVGEEGYGDFMRPKGYDDKAVVEIYKRNFRPNDLAGEVFSHIDPITQSYVDKFQKTITPQQLDSMKKHLLDYEYTMREITPKMTAKEKQAVSDRAVHNTANSAIRGYVFEQMPQSISDSFGYTPEQLAIIKAAKEYVNTGKDESNPALMGMVKNGRF